MKVTRDIGTTETYRYRNRALPTHSWSEWKGMSRRTTSISEDRLVFSQSNPAPYRSGGGFSVWHYKAQSWGTNYSYTSPDNTITGYGTALPPKSFSVPTYAASRLDELALMGMSYGTTAIAQARPGDSEANLLQSAIELKDFSPKDIQGALGSAITAASRGVSSKNRAKAIAEAYLFNEFGLKPLISELRSLSSLSAKVDKSFAALGSSKPRKTRRTRSKVFDESIDVETFDTSLVLMPRVLTTARYSPSTRVISRKVDGRFTGCWIYFMDNAPSASPVRDIWRKAQLYGLVPNIETIWQLTPWSFLADYVTNAGDVIHNLTSNATDYQVLKYGYVTVVERSSVVETTTATSVVGNLSATYQHELTIKVRVVASPYSFGLSPESLSPRQLSILGALGLTNGIRK